MTDSLTYKKCHECGKRIRIATYEPHEKANEAEGIHLAYLDDYGEESHLGWLCWSCVDTYEEKHPDMHFMMGFCGGGFLPDCQVWRKKASPRG